MHNLFRSRCIHLQSSLKCYYKNHYFLMSISKLHAFPKILSPNSKLDSIFNEVEALNSSIPTNQIPLPSSVRDGLLSQSEESRIIEPTYQISHPWPEWVDLMELLLKRGYFDANRNPFVNRKLGTKEANWIRTACLNFARNQFGLIRFLSRKDIRVITGCGCPSIDRKVVNSGKRLRAHVGIDEGNVCSSCKLRGDCERAYVMAREDECGRTVDVMRILFTCGLDSISGTLENQSFQNKMVEGSVRMLLKEMVECSNQELDSNLPDGTPLKSDATLHDHSNVPMKKGDWICTKCNFLNFARNIRCLRCDDLFQHRLKQLQEDQDHLPLKKGDWICEKCNFLNFAKNTRCLQCKEKPPKRHLNPGEWECESCNYINFRRNMVCLKCDHRRPKANAPISTSNQLEHDNGGYPNGRRLSFIHGENEANVDKSTGLDITNQRRRRHRWKFEEEEREDNCPNLSNDDSKFVDFPIVGGKSSLSQNARDRERWKLEMLEKSKTSTRTEENDEELRYTGPRRTYQYLETTDDEDMAEWFGGAKKMK